MNDTAIAILTAVTLVLSGTFAGYITNKYAVRWLFRPVTFFGKQVLDVSILSTEEKQEAFIESLSDCVETRILTADVIKNEIINEAMKTHLDDITGVFLTETLPESLKEADFITLMEYSEAGKTMRDFLEDSIDTSLDPLLGCVLKEILVSDYVTESQIDRGVDNIYDDVRVALKENYIVKDLVSRILGELFVQAVFDHDGRTALAKLTGKLFKSGGSKMGPLGPFDVDSVSLPEKIKGSIKKIIVDAAAERLEGKYLSDFVGKDTRAAIEKIIKEEILKAYDSFVEEHGPEDLTNLASKGSERLGESKKVRTGLSDFLYKYLESHIEGLLAGKVKTTVRLALGKLDPDQLLEVAEKLMRGQLAYLSYFGAVLGFIISIPALFITLGTFSVTGFPGSPALLVFLVLLMGAIGVLTNVIAIQMFFHPYREIGFLAKHKKLKVFSKGIILQNQKPFANTLGEYVGNSLLTADNITDTLRRFEPAFAEKLGAAVGPGMREWLENPENRRAAGEKLASLALEKTDENRSAVTNRVLTSLGAKNIESYINLSDPFIRAKADGIFMSVLNKLADNPPEGREENENASSESGLGALFGAALGISIASERENEKAHYDPDRDEDAEDFRFITWAIARLIRNSDSLTEKSRDLVSAFVAAEASQRGFGDIISMKEAGDSLEETIHSFCRSESAFVEVRQAVYVTVSSLVNRASDIILDGPAEKVTGAGIKAAFYALIENVPALTEDIHIGAVTEERVASLEPEEIKRLVLSFAESAIHRLYALGLIGCVFGINTYLAFIFFGVDKIRDRG